MTVRVGLRRIGVTGRSVTLDGAPLKLKGFNRHDAHPDYGAALPYEVIVGGVRWMVAAGANFVRGSHYPQDARLLDAADALGLLVWEEIIGWGVPVESLGSSRWLDGQLSSLDAMIRRRSTTRRSSSTACPTRPTRWRRRPSRRSAACRRDARAAHRAAAHLGDEQAKEGPQHQPRRRALGQRLPRMVRRRAERLADEEGGGVGGGHYPSKPYLIAEAGAGAIAGWRTMARTTASRCAGRRSCRRRLCAATQAALDDNIAGICVWQLLDIAVNPKYWPAEKRPALVRQGRPRRPAGAKLAAAAVATAFRAAVDF